MYIFISYASKEIQTAQKLCAIIENSGYHCFIAPRDIRSGYEYAEEIARGIDKADAVVVLMSKASNSSPHVLREIERAVSKAKPILVYKLETVELTKSMEYFLMACQWLEKGKNSYDDIVKGIHGLCGESVTTGSTKKKKVSRKWLFGAAISAVAILIAAGWMLLTAGKKPRINPGETITMGSYNGEDIQWRVLRISEDGTEAVLLSDKVLTIKAYDAAESGRYNHDGAVDYFGEDARLEEDKELQAYVRGNNSWENSNIRTWLNSASENVVYEGQAPTALAMADGVNGYNHEKGFLCSFSKQELERIKTTVVKTPGNVLADENSIETHDKVFLLSLEELQWLQEANVSLTATPTESAIENNQSTWYQSYCVDCGVDAIMWWLREPVDNSTSKCYLVGNGYSEENIVTWEVGVESFGIRPAMVIDLNAR